MKLLQGIVITALFASSSVCFAYSTYTKSELNRMYLDGTPPSQASPVSKSVPISFGSCKSKVKSIWNSTKGYPSYVIADNDMVFSVKLWTNDSAMVFTCSDPDQKLVITTSNYL